MADKFGPSLAKLGFYGINDEQPVAEQDVFEFEKEIGQPIPDGYRNFVLHHGMIAASNLIFPDPNQPNKPGGGVGVFYGLQKYDEYNLLSEWKAMLGIVPAGFLPIADSPGGLVGIILSGDERGAVYWWAAEDSRSGGRDDFYRIAPSFDDFFSSLSLYQS